MATGPHEYSPNPHSIFSLYPLQYCPLFQAQVSKALCIISDSSIKMSREFSLSPAYSTCPAHINLLEWITLISCGEGSKPRHFLLLAFIQRPLTVSPLDQILRSAPFYQTSSILGAFTKLRKATISFVMFCLSARNNSTPTGRIFMKFNIRLVVKTLRENFKFH